MAVLRRVAVQVEHGPGLAPAFRTIEAGGEVFQPRRATLADLGAISALISGAELSGKVIDRDDSAIRGWIERGMSFVAVDASNGRVVSHVAVHEWQGCLELSSAVTAKDHTNKGIYSSMHADILDAHFMAAHAVPIVSIKNEESDGRKLKYAAGFVETPMSEVQKLGVAILRPELGPWHAFILTQPAYLAAQAVRP